MDDSGPWFVRVIGSKVSVGIFACAELELADLIDEVCDADACEYRRLEPGGFVFGGEIVLHELNPEDDRDDHLSKGWLTDSWLDVYSDEGLWTRIDSPVSDNDNLS